MNNNDLKTDKNHNLCVLCNKKIFNADAKKLFCDLCTYKKWIFQWC